MEKSQILDENLYIFKIFFERLSNMIVPNLHMKLLLLIISSKIFPISIKHIHGKLTSLYAKMFYLKKSYKIIGFWAIRNRKKWYIMNASEDPRMKSHSNNRMKTWKYLKCLTNTLRYIVCFPSHNLSDKKSIILSFFSISRKYQKNRIISQFNKAFIHKRNNRFIFTKKSSSNRDSYKFIISIFFDICWWGMEKYNVLNLNRWEFKRIKKSLTLCISNQDKIPWPKKFSELHFILYFLDLKANSPKQNNRMSQTSNLYSK